MNLAVITDNNDKVIQVLYLDKITINQAMAYYNQGLIVHIRNN